MAKNKGGRPSAFSESLALRIMELATAGATEAEIAAKIGISVATLTNWKGNKPGFFDALRDAKSVADGLVEAALFSRAVGYSHPAVKFFWDSKKGDIKSQPYIERHAPDTTACIFWLKNRQPDLWRENKDRGNTEAETDFDERPKSPWQFRKDS